MKNTFVLNESTIICAQTGKNERGEDDTSALDLIRNIKANCHRIAVDYQLHENYKKKYNWLQRQRTSMMPESIPRLVDSMLRTADKGYFIQEVISIAEPKRIHHKDVPMVQLAGTVQGILVTTDDDLIEALNELDIESSYGVRPLRPEAALELAGPGDP